MFRFTIRDILWLTVVVAVALTLWLGWSRETATLRDESTAREAKLQNDIAAERDKLKAVVKEVGKAYTVAMTESLKQKAIAKKVQEISSDRKAKIIRLEDEIQRLKTETATQSN